MDRRQLLQAGTAAFALAASQRALAQTPATAPAEEIPGRAVVTLDAARQQLIGLRTTHAVMGKVGGIWRTVGRVEAEPTQVRSA